MYQTTKPYTVRVLCSATFSYIYNHATSADCCCEALRQRWPIISTARPCGRCILAAVRLQLHIHGCRPVCCHCRLPHALPPQLCCARRWRLAMVVPCTTLSNDTSLVPTTPGEPCPGGSAAMPAQHHRRGCDHPRSLPTALQGHPCQPCCSPSLPTMALRCCHD